MPGDCPGRSATYGGIQSLDGEHRVADLIRIPRARWSVEYARIGAPPTTRIAAAPSRPSARDASSGFVGRRPRRHDVKSAP